MTGEPVLVGNLQEAIGYVPPDFYADHGIVSTVDVLIKAHSGPPFGVLEVDSTHEHSYGEHDINYLTGFANVLAEAVAPRARDKALQATVARMDAAIAEKDRLLNERNLLATELQHRVRNNLQLINDMVTTQLRQTSNDEGSKGLRGTVRQIMSLAEVYEHLLGAAMAEQIDLGAYIEALCANLPDLQPAQAFPVALRCTVEAVRVSLATATALGLVVTELISNSFEHAFPGCGGTIDVSVGAAEPGERMSSRSSTTASDIRLRSVARGTARI